jgi:hypothetical protein
LEDSLVAIQEGIDPADFGWSLSGFAGQKMFIGTADLEGETFGFLLVRRRYGAGYLLPCPVSPFLYGEVGSAKKARKSWVC